jgi:hypothetical protein
MVREFEQVFLQASCGVVSWKFMAAVTPAIRVAVDVTSCLWMFILSSENVIIQ